MRPSLHPDFSYSIKFIGNEKQPLIIIDNYVDRAESLIDEAFQVNNLLPDPGYYPGLRAPTPELYGILLNEFLGPMLCDIFDLEANDISSVDSFFSMVCKPQEKLDPVQQIPHFDHPNPNELAAIHYLCSPIHGGTSFYRHRKTGYEYIDPQRSSTYLETLTQEVEADSLPTPPAYINGDTDLFQQIESVDAKFNRIIIYRCSSLHSGNIANNKKFDLNPRTGRFTVTSFLHS